MADSVGADPAAYSVAVCGVELQAISSKLNVIADRRDGEAREYLRYFDEETKARRPRRTPWRRSDRPAVIPQWLGCASWGALPASALGPRLRKLVRYVEAHDLGTDVIVENDPRENGAHAQWRRQPLPFGSRSLTPMRANVWLTLSDEEPALIDSVRHMIVALLAVVIGIVLVQGALTIVVEKEKSASSSPQADAIVAVLLIVPGILLARLDIPQTNTVLGVLRRLPRNVAYASVVVTSGLAVLVAPSGSAVWDLAACAVAVILLILLWAPLGLEKRARDSDRLRPIPRAVRVPAWLRSALVEAEWSRPSYSLLSVRGLRRGALSMSPDAVFEAVRTRFTAETETRPTGSTTGETTGDARRGRRRRAAELAGFGSRAAIGASSAVHFEVKHWTSLTRALGDRSRAASKLTSVQVQAPSTETSFFRTNQVALQLVVTPRPRGLNYPDPSTAMAFNDDIGDGRIFTGDLDLRPVPNLAGKPSLDLLVELPDDDSLLPTLHRVLEPSLPGRLRYSPGLRPGTALSSVFYPETTVYLDELDRHHPSGEQAWSSGARLALSLPESTESVRAGTLAHIAEVVEEVGAGLHVGAAHAHARRMEWSQIVAGPMQRPGRAPTGKEVLVTFLGSARGGRLGLVRDILAALQGQARAHAVALTTSQQYVQATLHLERYGTMSTTRHDSAGLSSLTEMFDHADAWKKLDEAGFHILVSTIDEAPGDVTAGAPLWLLWEGPPNFGRHLRRPGKRESAGEKRLPLIAVMESLERRDHSCALQQLRTRFGPGGMVWTRVKLWVSGVDDLETFARLAKVVEDEVARVCVDAGLDRHRFKLRVVIREWWL